MSASNSTPGTSVVQIDPTTLPLPVRSDREPLAHLCASQLQSPTNTPALEAARDLLARDEVVAMPTETVYGLAANALSPTAIAKIFAAKNRPLDNPLIVHVSSLEMLATLLPGGQVPDIYVPLLERFWPGPLTLLMRANVDTVPRQVTAGLPNVAVRMPAHAVARHLIAACKFPLAAPSANSSGRPSPTLASHVLADLGGRIPLILDGGQCDCGLESTVLDVTRTPPVILRPGSVTAEMLREVVPLCANVQVHTPTNAPESEQAPLAPGMKYRHYSPDAPVLLLTQSSPQRLAETLQRLRLDRGGDIRIGVLKTQPFDMADQPAVVKFDATASVSRELFKGLRWLDEQRVDVIVVEAVDERGEGAAVMNRLRKAASIVQ
ncbi:hypothetical protein RI367_002327 [Sorochytrium milnesiophthora]